MIHELPLRVKQWGDKIWPCEKLIKVSSYLYMSDKNMCYRSSEGGENIVHSGGQVGGYVEEEGLRGWF